MIRRRLQVSPFYYILILLMYQNLNFQEFTHVFSVSFLFLLSPSSSSLYSILFPFTCFSPFLSFLFSLLHFIPSSFSPFPGLLLLPDPFFQHPVLDTLLQLLLSMRTWILFIYYLSIFPAPAVCFPQIAFICFWFGVIYIYIYIRDICLHLMSKQQQQHLYRQSSVKLIGSCVCMSGAVDYGGFY